MVRLATLSGVEDPLRFTPEYNFGAGGQARLLAETTPDYSDAGIVWQQDVYSFARGLADSRQVRRVVELGCGAGQKFVRLFRDASAALFQVDHCDQRERPSDPEAFAAVTFYQANFEDYPDLEMLEERLASAETTLFILSDVIEHLHDPRPVLRFLRTLLKRNPNNRLVISTPDREQIDGRGANRVPDNRRHVRQWTLNEFGLSLMSAGFAVSQIGHVKANEYDDAYSTILAEIRCEEADYKAFLQRHGLPPQRSHLVITTEHSAALRTGGIGTYHARVSEVADEPPLVLMVGAHGLPDDWHRFVQAKGLLHVAAICGRPTAPCRDIAAIDFDEILRAVVQLVFLYDGMRLIEYQDYLGIGFRVAQAKRARLLPSRTTVLAYAHGSHFYLDHAADTPDPYRDQQVDLRERTSLELADVVWFPSEFLRDLYVNKQGLHLRAADIQAYPIRLGATSKRHAAFGPITTLVFYGKATPQKGYPEFCEAVLKLFSEAEYASLRPQISRIVLMGVENPDPRILALPGVKVEWGVWRWDIAYSMLESLAPHALVVLPYRADNHPLSIFEVVDAECQLLTFAAGGVPEVLPESLHDRLLCRPNADALARAMASAVRMDFFCRSELLKKTRYELRQRYLGVIESYKQHIRSLKQMVAPAPQKRGKVSIVVPNKDGPARYFRDLWRGIDASLYRPKEVIFVDDGSSPEGVATIEEAATPRASCNCSLIRKEVNSGLAMARNTGLEKVTSEYVCVHDNDNVLLNRYLDLACRILDENPDVAAVTSFEWYFQDGQEWDVRKPNAPGYRPSGADLAEGITENVFGDALAVYRTDVLKRLGGWDGTSGALWEDWQLFLRMAAQGYRILTIPQEMFMYRVRENSMLQTYSRFPGYLRVARALQPMPLADAIGVVRSAMKGKRLSALNHELRARVHHLEQTLRQQDSDSLLPEVSRLRAIESSTSWRATAPVRRVVAGLPPKARRAARLMAKAGWLGATLQFGRLYQGAMTRAGRLANRLGPGS
ncbi:MAG: glycosyltransferase [Thermoguttaceae bacterium]